MPDVNPKPDVETAATPSDLVRARRFWARWGTRPFRAMLRAKEEK